MEETTEQHESKTKTIVVVAALLIGGGAFLAYHLQKRDPAQPVAAAPAAPPAPKEAPPPEPPEPPAPPASDLALTDTLLGLNQPEPMGIAAMQLRARENAARAAAQPRKRRARASEAGEPEEPMPMEASGGLSDSAFHDTVERWRGLKSCLADKNKRPDAERGALRVAFTIASSGEVVSHRIFDESSDAAKALTPCLDRQLRTLKFPAFDGSKPDTKEAKFVF